MVAVAAVTGTVHGTTGHARWRPFAWLTGALPLRRLVAALFAFAVCSSVAYADAYVNPLRDRDEASVPLATKLLGTRLPKDTDAFHVVRFELEQLDFKRSAELLHDYDTRQLLRRLIGEPPSSASTFREAIAEEAAEKTPLAGYADAVLRQGLSIDFSARDTEFNFHYLPNLEYRKIEPGLWGMFRSSDPEKSVDTAIEYELPFTVTSRLAESVHLTFDLPRLGVEKEPLCIVDRAPKDVPVAASCSVQAPIDAEKRSKVLAALHKLPLGTSSMSYRSGSISTDSSFGYLQEREARSKAVNLLQAASCRELGTCMVGRADASSPWVFAAVLLIGMIYSVWRRVFAQGPPVSDRKFARAAFSIYLVLVIAAVGISVIDAGTKAPLSGVLGFLAVGIVSLPWSALSLLGHGMPDHAALKLMWTGAFINLVYLWIMAYVGAVDKPASFGSKQRSGQE